MEPAIKAQVSAGFRGGDLCPPRSAGASADQSYLCNFATRFRPLSLRCPRQARPLQRGRRKQVGKGAAASATTAEGDDCPGAYPSKGDHSFANFGTEEQTIERYGARGSVHPGTVEANSDLGEDRASSTCSTGPLPESQTAPSTGGHDVGAEKPLEVLLEGSPRGSVKLFMSQ